MLSTTVIKRLVLARYLFRLAEDNARSHREAAEFAAINILQDAIEIFMLGAFDRLNIATSQKTVFESYLDKINEHIETPIPYRTRLVEINKARVASKHYGIRPNSV